MIDEKIDILNQKDFINCGWKEILSNRKGKNIILNYDDAKLFRDAAHKASEVNQFKNEKIFTLLDHAVSMVLDPRSFNQPFRGMDLSESDIDFFIEIVDVIDDLWLKARIADLVWFKRRNGNIHFARIAIDAYRQIPLNFDKHDYNTVDLWWRGISLATRLNDNDSLKEMEANILYVFWQAKNTEESFPQLRLADLLHKHGLATEHALEIAEKLTEIARTLKFHDSRRYFGLAQCWFKKANETAKSTEMMLAIAESFENEGDARVKTPKPSYMAALHFYEQARQQYRDIPHKFRNQFKVAEKIEGLHQKRAEYQPLIADEMVWYEWETDITECVEWASNLVKDEENTLEALRILTFTTRPFDSIKKLRQEVLGDLTNAIIHKYGVASDGRTIAKRDPLHLETDAKQEEAVMAGMIEKYSREVSSCVSNFIRPALQVIVLEHQMTEMSFVDLSYQSPIVPKGRAELFGKGLFFGYDGDFVLALHLLVPQVEHIVRFHLKNAGVKTTNLDKDGIETENGLSTLVNLPETITVFGKDLAFELKALFCSTHGPNLRNQLAHGLLDLNSCRSEYSIYAWWLCLRIVLTPWWNAAWKETYKTNWKQTSENN
ncbi:MAG: DUF4209 domain-containing protein [Neisseriaceae bacterium]|nr:DUF4209 domain-containing protein [Neisseriaceae bacterium]